MLTVSPPPARRRPGRPVRYIPATWLQRFGALFLDVLVFIVCVAVPSTLASWWFGPETFTHCTFEGSSESCSMTPEAIEYTRTVFYLLTAVWVLVYSRSIARGASLGKRATEAIVVDARTGSPIGYRRALARTVLAMIGLAAFGIGLLIAFTNPERRAAHDLVMHTRVISP